MKPRGSGVALIVSLVKPYRLPLLIVLAAMIIETAAGLAAPWPLEIVIDSVLAVQRPTNWAWLSSAAALGVVAIALADGIASYVDNYYTESVGQHVANDLRMHVYDHLA